MAPASAAGAAGGEVAGAEAAGGAGAGAAAVGAATFDAAALSVTSVMISVPSETLSPTLILISCTLPESGAGTSIVALSDSRVIRVSSALTVSSGFTCTSITGTSLKSPMSGTRTSAMPAGALVGAGGAATDVFGAAAVAVAPVPVVSRSMMSAPSLTLSPTLSLTSLSTPPTGAGTSIVALSDSSDTSESSGLTWSPAFTITSITGTSLKSPMSGTFTSIIAAMCDPLRLEYQRPYTAHGSGRSVSNPYFLIASETMSALISPSSASAFSAATAT